MRIKGKIEKAKQKLVSLKSTRAISKADLEFPEWIELQEVYKSISEKSDKPIVSILNSILHQRRVYFVMTRDSVRELVKSDANWKGSAGLSNDNWGTLLVTMENAGLIKCVQVGMPKADRQTDGTLKAGRKTKASIFKVIDPEVLKYLVIDEEKQFQECVDFIEEKSSDGKPDQETGPSISRSINISINGKPKLVPAKPLALASVSPANKLTTNPEEKPAAKYPTKQESNPVRKDRVLETSELNNSSSVVNHPEKRPFPLEKALGSIESFNLSEYQDLIKIIDPEGVSELIDLTIDRSQSSSRASVLLHGSGIVSKMTACQSKRLGEMEIAEDRKRKVSPRSNAAPFKKTF